MKGKTPLDRLLLLVAVCLVAGSAFGQTRDTVRESQSTTGSPKSIKNKATAKTQKNANLIEINSAPKLELMTLPDIGDADAQKIIDGRPYRVKTELVQKNIIPQATYDKIAGSIIAKRSRPPRRRPSVGITASKRTLKEVALFQFPPCL
jgi:competence protein ComEA